MQQLHQGKYFGVNKKVINFEGLIVSDTIFSNMMNGCPWHYHENAYFAYTMKGNMRETNKKESYHSSSGTLLFHNWQEPHCNSDYSETLHGFHVEIEKKWFEHHHLKQVNIEGSINISNPLVKTLFLNISKETKINDNSTQLSLEGLLLQVLAQMMRLTINAKSTAPHWTNRIKEILHDRNSEKLTLNLLANEIGIHPVYLSQAFPKYFHTSFGNYIRKIKIEKTILLLTDNNLSLTEIAYECGFADQSHLIRCFKRYFDITPSEYRKRVLKS